MIMTRSILVLLSLLAALSAAGQARTVTCESQNDGYRRCDVGDVQRAWIDERLSDAECIANRTWGFDGRGIWVDKGCRAEISYLLRSTNIDEEDRGYAPRLLRCESKNGRRTFCPADTHGGVTLKKQLSILECTRGETWGYNREGVWVDEGCRAEFILGGATGRPVRDGELVRCESTDGRRKFCRAETGGGVELSRQLSKTDCIEDDTWGWNRDGIWVTDGCRGEFTTHRRRRGEWSGRDDRSAETISCESRDGEREFCRADTSRGVTLIRQKSRAECVRGQSWGYDRNGIWVDDGCRAEFRLGR
jgi:hypothetical protein